MDWNAARAEDRREGREAREMGGNAGERYAEEDTDLCTPAETDETAMAEKTSADLMFGSMAVV